MSALAPGPDPAPEVDPALDPLVCFDLYAAQRAVTAAYRPILDGLGLTYPQYLVLVLLWERDAVPIKQLAARLRLDHATLTPLLRRMQAAGFVLRERSRTDERIVIVRLTAQGDALRDQADAVQCRISEALGLDDADASALSGLLRQVTGHLRAGAPPA